MKMLLIPDPAYLIRVTSDLTYLIRVCCSALVVPQCSRTTCLVSLIY